MNWIIAALAVGLALAIGAVALSQNTSTANVEVRVWQKVDDTRALYISARPEGGSWETLGTIPLPLDDGYSSSERFRYGDITVAVPVASAMKDVEVRVWQDVNNARNIYISARPDGGSWRTLGTIPIPLTDGVSSNGHFRYGDITLAVELEEAVEPEATPIPTATPTPTPGPTYGSCLAAWRDGYANLTEEEARALGLPLERSDSDDDGVYCERRTRPTATPTPSPTPVPTATPTPVPTATPIVSAPVATPVPSQPSGAAPTARPTPSLTDAEVALVHDQAARMAALNAEWARQLDFLTSALRGAKAVFDSSFRALKDCDARAAALNTPRTFVERGAVLRECDRIAGETQRHAAAHDQIVGQINALPAQHRAAQAALVAVFQQELAALRASYQ